MPAIQLTPAQRKEKRADAHHLDPVVLIGGEGLTPAVLKEADAALNAHGLIKVRVFSDDRAARETLFAELSDRLDAAPVQHIGKLLVLYRPKKEAEKARTGKTGKGMRMVTIVKPSASGTKKPSVSKVMLKGNERVTEGGTIKRAKKRQSSTKKSALG